MNIGEDKSVTTADKNLSTDIDANDWYAIEKRITEQQELIEMLQSELRGTRPSIKLQNDDNQICIYTGLPSYSVFIGLLNLLVGVMSKHLSHGLSVSDQFLMVLMKLRLAVPNQDLASLSSIDLTLSSLSSIDSVSSSLIYSVKGSCSVI